VNISLLAIASLAKVLRVKPTDFIKTAPTHTPQRIKSRRCIVRIARRLQVGMWDAGREFVVLQWIASQVGCYGLHILCLRTIARFLVQTLLGIASKSSDKLALTRWFDRITLMTNGQIYRCPNRDCFNEVTAFIQPANGTQMKKPYAKPLIVLHSVQTPKITAA
jgi:hypothetical protein